MNTQGAGDMRMPEMLDNVSKTVKDDLTVSITKGDRLSIAAACFSIYAYQAFIKLRNELTQKAIAREFADWIKKKVQFRSNLTGGKIGGFMNVIGTDDTSTYLPLNGYSLRKSSLLGNNERMVFIFYYGDYMNVEIHKLTPELAEDYARFFDETPHNDEFKRKCYCVSWRADAAKGEAWPDKDCR
jgi:hypothetical protein